MFQSVTNDHITGAIVGAGILAAGYYIYKKNQSQVDMFMRNQGMNMGMNMNSSRDYRSMSLEELLETKELIEDIIAEKEAGGNYQAAPSM